MSTVVCIFWAFTTKSDILRAMFYGIQRDLGSIVTKIPYSEGRREVVARYGVEVPVKVQGNLLTIYLAQITGNPRLLNLVCVNNSIPIGPRTGVEAVRVRPMVDKQVMFTIFASAWPALSEFRDIFNHEHPFSFEWHIGEPR